MATDTMEIEQIELGPVRLIPAEPSVGSLVELAIKQGVDVSVLERLVALQERVTERNARSAFFEALAAFRAECPPIVKTRENTQFSVTRNGTKQNARYAPLEEIDRVARPICSKHGLVWTWDTRIEGEMMHVPCRLIHVLGHSETSTVSMPFGSNAGASPQQKYGAAQSYGMRYSLIAALGITTADEDTDGAGDAEELTMNEADSLDSLMRETGIPRARFFKWLRVEGISQISKADYKRAVDRVEEYRRTGK